MKMEETKELIRKSWVDMATNKNDKIRCVECKTFFKQYSEEPVCGKCKSEQVLGDEELYG